MSPLEPISVPDANLSLPGGGRMPLLGFGTWQLKGGQATSATAAALEAGYRQLDTATIYGNEREVGTALRESALPRGDVFVTTKCPPRNVGRERETLEQSLELLGTDHVDLWLIHWPPPDAEVPAMWAAFLQAKADGLARDIGVSNFPLDLIDEVSSDSGTAPAVNQVEWSPLLYDAQVLDGHRSRGVALEGYSALRGGTLDHPTITGIAEAHGRTPAQVIIRWHLQHDVIVIPKSREPERIRSNADVTGFELSADELAALDALGRE